MKDRQQLTDQDYREGRPFDDEVIDHDFEDCDFTESDLSALLFEHCTFQNCNLSMTDIGGTRFQDVSFTDCKLMGVDFSVCSDFGFSAAFRDCNMNYASFWGLDMAHTEFADCGLKEVNFTDADLTKASFSGCDLRQAVFAGSTLEGADFRGARNFSIDPENNEIEGAKFSRSTLAGLLQKYDIVVE